MDLKLKGSITRIMEYHHGMDRAISREDLRQSLFLDFEQDRLMRKTIESLRHEGLPILFCENGYYLPASKAELDTGLQPWKSRLKSEGQIYARLKRNGLRYLQGESQGILI